MGPRPRARTQSVEMAKAARVRRRLRDGRGLACVCAGIVVAGLSVTPAIAHVVPVADRSTASRFAPAAIPQASRAALRGASGAIAAAAGFGARSRARATLSHAGLSGVWRRAARTPEASLRTAYAQLAGQGLTGIEQLDLDANAQLRAPVRAEVRRGLARRHAGQAWAMLFDGGLGLDGVAGSGAAGVQAQAYGGELGRQRRIGPHALVGLEVGASSGNFSLTGTTQSGSSGMLRVGGYAGWRRGPVGMDATIGVSGYDNVESRTMSIMSAQVARGASRQIPEVDAAAGGANESISADAQVDGSYYWRGFGQRLRAFSGAGMVELREHSLRESGSSGVLLHPDQRIAWRTAWVGVGWRHGSPCSRTALSLRLQHAWLPAQGVRAMFVGAPTVGFSVLGARAPADTLHAGLGLLRCPRRGLSWNAALSAVLARGEGGLGVDAGLRWLW